MRRHGAWVAALFALLAPVDAPPAVAQTVAVFSKSQGNPVARAIRIGVEITAKKHGAKVFHYIPTSANNVAQQTALVDEAIRSKPDFVIFTPTDAKAMVAAVGKLVAAGIPVVNVNDRLAGGNVLAFVGTDDQALARATARVLLKAMGGKGGVVILEGPANLPSSVARVKGFNEALKEFPQVKLLASRTANYARAPAVSLLKDFIRQFPQIDGVLAANDPMASGAIEALKVANRKALVVGINASREAVDLIKSGAMLASGDYNGFIEGCVAAEIAFRNLRKQVTPKQVILNAVVVDKSNYAPFETPIDKRNCPALEAVAAN